jgi:hypothetical protein
MPKIAKRGPAVRNKDPTPTKRMKTDPEQAAYESSPEPAAERQPDYTNSELEAINDSVPRTIKDEEIPLSPILPDVEAVPAVPIEIICIDLSDDETA